MGVKHFFIWLRKNFPEALQQINKDETFATYSIEVDNLCLDMNGIFHNCAQKIYEYGSFEKKSLLRKQKFKKGIRWQRLLYEEICNQVEHYRRIVKPRKRIILCVDGVAGRAKMNQQRQRRFRSEPLSNCDFDSTSLTPGTKLMDNLSRYIEWYLRIMISNSPEWENLEVIYSGDKVPGEGEHKIINYIRHNPNQGESYCIHGLDADLIMLSLATRSKSMYVLRENVRNFSELHLIDIGKLNTQLAYHLKWDREYPTHDKLSEEAGTTSEPKQFEKYASNNGIDDFIFMCFLVGNDFVPTIPTLAILDGGIDSMIDVYRNMGKSYGHLTRISRKSKDITIMFRQQALSVFLGTLAQYESGLLEAKFNKKQDFVEDPLLTQSMGPIHQDESGNFIQSIDFEKYKNKFYTKKFSFVDESTDTTTINSEVDKNIYQQQITKLCSDYLRGLQWVMTYYKKGMPDWNWYFDEFYAPFLCDLSKVAMTSLDDQQTFTVNKPADPFLQLICVLPPRSSNLLPEPLSSLVGSENSPLKPFIPDHVTIDCTGKRQEWEGIVILPPIDMNIVSRHYNTSVQLVNEGPKRLNCVKQSMKLTYDQKSRGYEYNSFYGNILDCKTKVEYFDI